ncbi:MAG: hypothetical protein NUV82_02835 [Candidatus Komeilibacteria bacterium]|nr:hypothetical protein [Candidatus Komeilibacteria bacterium]
MTETQETMMPEFVDHLEERPMEEEVKEKLHDFIKYAGLGDWQNKSQEDKKKFYDFIRAAYAVGNLNIPLFEFTSVIRSFPESADVDQTLIHEFHAKYQKGIDILLIAI